MSEISNHKTIECALIFPNKELINNQSLLERINHKEHSILDSKCLRT